MKQFLSSALLCALCSAFAWAAPPRPSLTTVKAHHPHVQRHRAHKAGKHRRPRRHHRTV